MTFLLQSSSVGPLLKRQRDDLGFQIKCKGGCIYKVHVVTCSSTVTRGSGAFQMQTCAINYYTAELSRLEASCYLSPRRLSVRHVYFSHCNSETH